MRRTLVLLLALASCSLAAAHTPPAPDPNCSSWSSVHDYMPVATGMAAHFVDGNVAACPMQKAATRGYCAHLLDIGANDPGHPLYGYWYRYCYLFFKFGQMYDGEPEGGYGGALLFSRSGDGLTSGVFACYGPRSFGHHSPNVWALDELGHGPALSVAADHSKVPPESGPDCGDGVLQPCDAPFLGAPPVDPLVDMADALLRDAVCNPEDRVQLFDASFDGPSGGELTFAPGADGSYVVFVTLDQGETPGVATAGHIWSV